jgi:hypothetical protein
MRQHVAFYNRFVELEELEQFIGAADIYVTPYLTRAQATSGTLCYAFGCGKAVISTPYWHAEELLTEDRGVLVPFQNSAAIATAVCGLLEDEARLHAMRERAYRSGRGMIWSEAVRHYFASFCLARSDHRHHHGPRFAVKTLAQQPLELPELTLDHVVTGSWGQVTRTQDLGSLPTDSTSHKYHMPRAQIVEPDLPGAD